MKILTTAKATALAIAVQQITGSLPVMVDRVDWIDVSFSPDQQLKIRKWIEAQIDNRDPGDVRFDLNPIVFPILFKRVLPFFVGAAVIGFLAGKLV